LESRYYARDGLRYSLVSPGSLYEHHVEKLVFTNLHVLFPEYLGVRYEPHFETEIGNVRPDIVLIRHDGEGWALLEIELEEHSFSNHVLPQLGKLRRAESSEKLVKALCDQIPDLPKTTIRKALAHRPQVFLAVHGTSTPHTEKLTKLGVEVRNLDILKASDAPNEYILVITDPTVRRRRLPHLATRSTSVVTRNIWKFNGNDLTTLMTNEDKVEVEFRGFRSFWSATRVQDGMLLRQPNLISDSRPEIDEMMQAIALVDDENRILYLEATRGKL
jgi:hypothetical protein